MRTRTHRGVAWAAAVVAVTLLSACGSNSTPASPAGSSTTSLSTPAGDSSAAAPGSGGTVAAGPKTDVTVGVGGGTYLVSLSTPFFAADGLNVVKQTVASGAAAIPLLLNGQIQFTAADSVGALTAISKGVPLVIVAMAATSGSTAKNDATGVLVKSGGDIKSAKDLSGKKIAVNGIGNTSQLSAAAAIDKLGGDSTKVHFVEIPPPTMAAGVAGGLVDAAVLSEPAITQGKSKGLRSLFSPMAEALPSVPLFVYITSKQYLAQHPDVVNKFAESMSKANTYESQHPDVVRAFAAKVLTLTPADAAAITLPAFVPATIGKPAMEQVQQLMLKYKTIKAPVNLDTALYAP